MGAKCCHCSLARHKLGRLMYQDFKRTIDIVLAFFMLVLFSPLLLGGMAAVYLCMGRPVIFCHWRSGLEKRPFKVYKLRSMMNDPSGTLSDSERITTLGHTIRKFSIDELPQLWNVLKGDMSLVGPRPLLPEYDEKYDATQNRRFEVRPGITGLAQVTGRNAIGWEQKLKLDVEYVEKIGFVMDMSILLRTVGVVLRSTGFRSSGEDKKFGEHR